MRERFSILFITLAMQLIAWSQDLSISKDGKYVFSLNSNDKKLKIHSTGTEWSMTINDVSQASFYHKNKTLIILKGDSLIQLQLNSGSENFIGKANSFLLKDSLWIIYKTKKDSKVISL